MLVSPWFYDALRGGDEVEMLSDCTVCQNSGNSDASRQAIGCGWLVPVPDATPWHPTGWDGDPLTTCPGYTVRLPQVQEANRARLHWERGTLVARCNGEPPTPILLDALEHTEAAQCALLNAKSKRKD